MGTTGSHKLELWRRQLRRRKAKREALELKQVSKPRPQGNPATLAATYALHQISSGARQYGQNGEAQTAELWPLQGVPIPKHVPHNTHRAGSIAYALLYNYWLPNATDRK